MKNIKVNFIFFACLFVTLNKLLSLAEKNIEVTSYFLLAYSYLCFVKLGYMSKKYDVFISYSRGDLAVVKNFVEGLRVQLPDLVCFFDLNGIESGEEFDEKIIAAIDNSSYVLYFLSPNSMKSKWTKEEVMYAKNRKKKVIPILLNGAQLEGWFLFHFGRINYVDISNAEQVGRLINDLSTWTNKKNVEQTLHGSEELLPGEQSVSDGAGKADEGVRKDSSGDITVQASWGTTTVKPANNVGVLDRAMKIVMAYKKQIGIILILLVLLFLCGVLISQCDGCSSDRNDMYPIDSIVVTDSIDSISLADSTENGHDYVDLGLSVKWATCNVGAGSPEDYGDYFAWGETQPKSDYTWSTYKWCRGNYNNLTKYCTDSDRGTVDDKTQLDLSDDAARVNWGGSWRMPTYDELTELIGECNWTWTTHKGVNGYKVTSKVNGRSIFLPAARYRRVSGLKFVGTRGCYWSSSLFEYGSCDACYLKFDSSAVVWNTNRRDYGLSVRPVCP